MHRALVLAVLAGCAPAVARRPVPPPPLPAAPATAVEPAAPPSAPPGPSAIDRVADEPPKTLADLWLKRLATAHLAGAEPRLREEALSHLLYALGRVTLDEELAVLAKLPDLAPLFVTLGFGYAQGGAKEVHDARTWMAVRDAENARRRPYLVALFPKLAPEGRRAVLTITQSDPTLEPEYAAIIRKDRVCPTPLHDGMRGFARYEVLLRDLECPTAHVPAPSRPAPKDLLACVRTTVEPGALPREAWFFEARAHQLRSECDVLANGLAYGLRGGESPKAARATLEEAFAASDLEMRALLVDDLLRVGAKIPRPALNALLADRRTRAATVSAYASARRQGELGAAAGDRRANDEARLVADVRWHFGSVPDVIEALPPTRRAKDGQPANLFYWRFRATGDRDNAALGAYEFATGDEVGTKWSQVPGALRAWLDEHIHDGRSLSLFAYDSPDW